MLCLGAAGLHMAPKGRGRGGSNTQLAMRVLVVVGLFAAALSTTGLLEQVMVMGMSRHWISMGAPFRDRIVPRSGYLQDKYCPVH